MWKNSSQNKQNFISLHDCKATNITIQEDHLFFEFDDGFWISPIAESNPFGYTAKTDKSEIQLIQFNVSNIYIFKEFRLLRRPVIIKRDSLDLEKLMANINCGKWELEFINEYHARKDVLYQCCIWTKQRPYHMDCQIELDCDAIEYHWNDLRKDRPW